MNKTRLQELCHRKWWNPPEYSTTKDGPPHNPTFSATVTIGGLSFSTDHPARSSKEAQNNAAGLAIQYFTEPKTPPLADSLSANTDRKNIPATTGTSQPAIQATSQSHQAQEAFLVTRDDKKLGSSSASNIVNNVPATKRTLQLEIDETCQTPEGMQHLYKTQLQTYAQKRNLPLPMYSFESTGPSHNSRFKSKVTIGGQTYDSPDFFPTLKDAEHAAAKCALMSLSPAGVQEDDYGVYKNLLQELARKEGYPLPVYSTEKSGMSHMPTFLSTVEIEGEAFVGQKAKTKKQAEMNAAKVAYTRLKERGSGQRPKSPSPHFQAVKAVDEFPPSSSPSSGVADLPQIVRPKSTMILLNQSTIFSEQDEDGANAVSLNGPSLVSPEIQKDPAASSSYTSSSPQTGHSSPPAVSESCIDLVPPGGNEDSSCEKVIVFPCKSKISNPRRAGAILRPVGDEWVAAEFSLDSS